MEGVPSHAVKRVRRNTLRALIIALIAAAVTLSVVQVRGLDVQIQSPVSAAPADLQAALRAGSVDVVRVYDADPANAPHLYPVLWQVRHGQTYRTDVFDSSRNAVLSGLWSSALQQKVLTLQPGRPPAPTYRGGLADLWALVVGGTLAVLLYLFLALICRHARNPVVRYVPAVLGTAVFLVVVGVVITNLGSAPGVADLTTPPVPPSRP